MSAQVIVALHAVVERHVFPEVAAWLAEQLAEPDRFGRGFASAGRRLGTTSIGAADAVVLARVGLPWPATAGVDECGRGALVLAAVASRVPVEQVALVRELVRRGEVRERQAVLRILAALPESGRFAEIGVEACRTNIKPVFEAIACDNELPARSFDESAFNQLVVKALSIGAPVARVVGLARRTSDELKRMVEAFAREREIAGRPIPEDVHLIWRPA